MVNIGERERVHNTVTPSFTEETVAITFSQNTEFHFTATKHKFLQA